MEEIDLEEDDPVVGETTKPTSPVIEGQVQVEKVGDPGTPAKKDEELEEERRRKRQQRKDERDAFLKSLYESESGSGLFGDIKRGMLKEGKGWKPKEPKDPPGLNLPADFYKLEALPPKEGDIFTSQKSSYKISLGDKEFNMDLTLTDKDGEVLSPADFLQKRAMKDGKFDKEAAEEAKAALERAYARYVKINIKAEPFSDIVANAEASGLPSDKVINEVAKHIAQRAIKEEISRMNTVAIEHKKDKNLPLLPQPKEKERSMG